MQKITSFVFLFFFILNQSFVQNLPKIDLHGAWNVSYAHVGWSKKYIIVAAFLQIVVNLIALGFSIFCAQVRNQFEAVYITKIKPLTAVLNGLQARAPYVDWGSMTFINQKYRYVNY
jgi:hypothetical protein